MSELRIAMSVPHHSEFGAALIRELVTRDIIVATTMPDDPGGWFANQEGRPPFPDQMARISVLRRDSIVAAVGLVIVTEVRTGDSQNDLWPEARQSFNIATGAKKPVFMTHGMPGGEHGSLYGREVMEAHGVSVLQLGNAEPEMAATLLVDAIEMRTSQ